MQIAQPSVAEMIKVLRSQGASMRAIADELEVSSRTVWKIVGAPNWHRHLALGPCRQAVEWWSLRPQMTARLPFSMLFVSGLLICPSIGQASEEVNDDVQPLRAVTYNLLHGGPGSGFLNGDTYLEERLEIAIRTPNPRSVDKQRFQMPPVALCSVTICFVMVRNVKFCTDVSS